MSEKQKHDKGRKWQITINNPLEHGLDHETIKDADRWTNTGNVR